MYTSETKYHGLPQFNGTDRATFTDLNVAFIKIDLAMDLLQTQIDALRRENIKLRHKLEGVTNND